MFEDVDSTGSLSVDFGLEVCSGGGVGDLHIHEGDKKIFHLVLVSVTNHSPLKTFSALSFAG